MVMQIFFAGGVMFLCVLLCLWGLMLLDKEHGLRFSAHAIGMLCLGCFAAAILWYITTVEGKVWERFLWLLIHVCILCCSMTDHQTLQVYDIFQYAGIILSACLLLTKANDMWLGISLILFALMQYLVFMRWYGSADGMALLVTAMAEASLGYDINVYLTHMIIAYLLLSVVQGMRGNIGRKGRLSKPVAFLPYIMVGFWVILAAGKCG